MAEQLLEAVTKTAQDNPEAAAAELSVTKLSFGQAREFGMASLLAEAGLSVDTPILLYNDVPLSQIDVRPPTKAVPVRDGAKAGDAVLR